MTIKASRNVGQFAHKFQEKMKLLARQHKAAAKPKQLPRMDPQFVNNQIEGSGGVLFDGSMLYWKKTGSVYMHDQVFASPCLQYDQVSSYITSQVAIVRPLMQHAYCPWVSCVLFFDISCARSSYSHGAPLLVCKPSFCNFHSSLQHDQCNSV